MQQVLVSLRRRADPLIGVLLFLFTFAVYLRTLAPSVAEIFDDSLEFQLVAPRLAIAHPTGYPLFSILTGVFTFLPIGDDAYRVNLATAFFGALAIPVLYAAARQLISSRAAAAIGALIFAFGETFWSQAVLAEVYTLQALLTAALICLALIWGSGSEGPAEEENSQDDAVVTSGAPSRSLSLKKQDKPTRVTLVTIAFFFGLMLTHHRMTLLLLPALAVYVLVNDRKFLREPGTLFRMALAFVLPLLIYLYIPLRGLVTSSLDGTYQNTPAGFLNWVLASGYSAFLTQNPFHEQRAAVYYLDLFGREFTGPGLALAVIGLIALARRRLREWLLLALALGANLVFALSYHVTDINVFFIPSFLFTALFVAVGVDWLVQLPSNVLTNGRLYAPLSTLLLVLSALVPLSLLQTNFPTEDLSEKWDVHDYGVDVLSQPLPANSAVVGLLGEMTLLRYFQQTQNMRPDLQTTAADSEAARLSQIENDLKDGHTVFLTRPLAGAQDLYSLASFGPLVLVQLQPNTTNPPSPSHVVNQDFGGVTLIGYDLDLSGMGDSPGWHLTTGRRLRVTLFWHVENKISNDRYVSIKLLTPAGQRGAQLDRRPVLDTYPTTAWRPGEYISDTYDVPVLVGAAPGEYNLQATLYDPNTGQVHGQIDLTRVTLAADTSDHPIAYIDVDHQRLREFGGINLIGYSLNTNDPYPPGATIPLTLVWRATAAGVQRKLGLRLLDADDLVVATNSFTLGDANTLAGQYLRQEKGLSIPKGQPNGSLQVELDYSPRDDLACELPFITPCTILGQVEVRK